MDENLIFDLTRQALWIAVRMSAPLLAVALVAGVVIGLFQALTSVQEMTLTFVPKAAVMLGVGLHNVLFWTVVFFLLARRRLVR